MARAGDNSRNQAGPGQAGPGQAGPTDQQLELAVATMLKIGVTLAAIVVLAGGALSLLHPWSSVPDYRHFGPGDATLRTLPGIFGGALRLDAAHLIQMGLLLLVATPVARVALLVVGFGRQRDWLYLGISAAVLVILGYALTRS